MRTFSNSCIQEEDAAENALLASTQPQQEKSVSLLEALQAPERHSEA